MVRPVTDDDIGLVVLRDAPADAAEPIDIVAVHGLGAHPDDSWCKNVGTKDSPRWVNWLVEESMLPAVAPQARIMRYGYQSQWFGEGAMRQKASTVAQRLLLALGMEREEHPFRPLLFVAHCFGGLVVLKALLDARHDESEWPGVFASTTGLIFFGTPFRGAEGMSQVEMLAAAQREYEQDEIQADTLAILQPGNEFLQEVVDQFGKTRGLANKAQVTCFYELKSSNVGGIVGKVDRTKFVVSESSGCLDLSDATSKRSLSRTHFDMNKFGKPTEEDFRIVSKVVKDMVKASPGLMLARSQYAGKHKVDFSLRGVPVVGRFIARDAEMQQLEKLLLSTQRTAGRRNVAVAHGLGGIGKTQLAVEFARKHRGSFSSVFWLDGSSEASVKQSLADTALRLPRDELTADGAAMLKAAAVDVDMAVRECLHWLALPSNGRWLLVIDNVDRDHRDRGDSQAYDVKKYLPPADHGSVLVTSRLPGLRTLGAEVKVGAVGPEQARAMLESNAGKTVEDADTVLDLLRGLPLALTQAGAYMRETNASALEYAQHYKQTWGRLMKKQERLPLEEYGNRSVLTTWTLSYEQVQRQSKAAASLLKLWGCLDSGELWYELIAAGKALTEETDVPAWLCEIAEDKLEFGAAAGLLCRYSLADATAESGSFSMHAVLHRWCGQLAEGQEQQELYCVAAGLVAEVVPMKEEAEYWRKQKRLLAHGISVSKWIDDGHAGADGVATLFLRPGQYYSLGYLLTDEDRLGAVKLYKRALKGYEKAWGAEHTSTLNTVNNLGILYKGLGQHEQAEEMYKRALQGYEKAWGAEHTSTLNTVNNLGNLYADLGQHEQAEEMYMRALKGKKEAWGAEHTSTLSTVNNLGGLYADLGQHKQAEEMYMRALQGYEKAWGAEHTSTLDTVNNLGILYKDLGQHEQAEEMYMRALKGKEKAWGAEHTSTLNTVNNLGSLYADLGQHEQAEEMYMRALKGKEKAWGAEHTSTLNTVNNLGSLYADLGQHEQAEEMYMRALKGKEEAWGAEHTSTLNTVNNLGSLYADLGQHEQAEEMYKRALEGYTKALGPKSVSTYVPALNTMWARGSLSDNLGQVDKARAWYSKALLGYEAVFGTEHLKCQPLRNNLAALKEAETKSNTCVMAESVQGVEANVASNADASPR